MQESSFRLVLLQARGDGTAGRRAGAADGERRRGVLDGGPVESPSPGEREVPLS
ncbi:hypothetical protein ACVNF4_32635 [Streptomyces sp. S6]